MKVKLSNQAWAYLKDNNQIELSKMSIISNKSHFYLLILDENSADEIREWALEKKVRVGFDEKYNLNEEGKILENVIDKFFVGN